MQRRINTLKKGFSIRALALGLAFALGLVFILGFVFTPVLPQGVVFMQAQAAEDDRPLVDGKVP